MEHAGNYVQSTPFYGDYAQQQGPAGTGMQQPPAVVYAMPPPPLAVAPYVVPSSVIVEARPVADSASRDPDTKPCLCREQAPGGAPPLPYVVSHAETVAEPDAEQPSGPIHGDAHQEGTDA